MGLSDLGNSYYPGIINVNANAKIRRGPNNNVASTFYLPNQRVSLRSNRVSDRGLKPPQINTVDGSNAKPQPGENDSPSLPVKDVPNGVIFQGKTPDGQEPYNDPKILGHNMLGRKLNKKGNNQAQSRNLVNDKNNNDRGQQKQKTNHKSLQSWKYKS